MNREPFLRTLTRNTLLSIAGTVVLWLTTPHQASAGWTLLADFTLVFCFAFVGHYVEVLLLMIPGIEDGSAAGRLVRLAGWFAGGLWCYTLARRLWLVFGFSIDRLPALIWGGVFFIVLELVIHAYLKSRGRASFYG